jgi:predicted GNAT family acetyltransferase
LASDFFGNRKRPPALVTSGHFELERDEHTADFEYTIAEHSLDLLHAEVPAALRGSGIASILAKTAPDWAREHQMRVD